MSEKKLGELRRQDEEAAKAAREAAAYPHITRVVITIYEPQPGQLNISVEGPDNPVTLAGIMELAKSKVLDNAFKPQAPSLVKAGAGLLRKLNGQG